MTSEEFAEKERELLAKLPEEFRGPVSGAALERGHAYGLEEVLYHVDGLVEMLQEPIKQYTQRIKDT